MAEKITYSTQSYTPFKLKSGNTTSFKLMGSSAVKFLGGLFGGGGGGGGIFGRIRDRMQKGNMAETQSMNAGAAAEGGGGGGVPPHGPEAHTGGGGAIGGAPQERGGGLDLMRGKRGLGQSFMGGGGGGGVWNVGNAMGEMEGMDRIGRKEYMGGLDKGQQNRIQKAQQRQRMDARTQRLKSSTFSDIRLKEKIEKTGVSPSGIPIYEFNYIGDSNRYSGAMAQDLLEINPNAVMMDISGYYKVNYNNIDVDMHLIN